MFLRALKAISIKDIQKTKSDAPFSEIDRIGLIYNMYNKMLFRLRLENSWHENSVEYLILKHRTFRQDFI